MGRRGEREALGEPKGPMTCSSLVPWGQAAATHAPPHANGKAPLPWGWSRARAVFSSQGTVSWRTFWGLAFWAAWGEKARDGDLFLGLIRFFSPPAQNSNPDLRQMTNSGPRPTFVGSGAKRGILLRFSAYLGLGPSSNPSLTLPRPSITLFPIPLRDHYAHLPLQPLVSTSSFGTIGPRPRTSSFYHRPHLGPRSRLHDFAMSSYDTSDFGGAWP